MIDLKLIETGSPYSTLNKSFIIFICMKNPFPEKLLHKYTFENRCIENPEIILNDQTTKIIVTPDSVSSDISKEMQDFLNYLVNKIPNSGLTQSIDAAVERAKAKEEWRLEYMTLHMKIEEGRKEGFQEGLEKGLQEGMQEGLEKGVQKNRADIYQMVDSLSKEGKSSDEILECLTSLLSEAL